jgi:DNA topoisomerase IA
VRPSEVEKSPESLARYLSPDLLKLYTLIWNRFVASQMTPAVYETTSVDIRVDRAQGDPVTFRAVGHGAGVRRFHPPLGLARRRGRRADAPGLPRATR